MPFAPRCPEIVAVYNLRLAAIELCERGRVWRYMMQIDVTENHFEITGIPAYGTVHKIERVRMIDALVDLLPVAAHDVPLEQYEPHLISSDMDQSAANDDVEQSPPIWFTQPSPNRLTLIPFQEGTVTVSAFLKPHLSSRTYAANLITGVIEDSFDRVPGYIASLYGQALADGALARLLMHTKAEYADPNLAQAKAMAAEMAIRKLTGSSVSGQQRAPARTKTHWF